MRKPSVTQSALRAPLNQILGAEANVRVLRTILLSPNPLGAAEIARRTSLQPVGVPKVCSKLEDLGCITTVGTGRNRQFQRAPRSELMHQLSMLFDVERQRADRVFSEITEAVRSIAGIEAAWMEGPVVLGTDVPADALTVGVLTSAESVEKVRHPIWSALLAIQLRNDVVLELSVVTTAELMTATSDRLDDLADAKPIVGAPPIAFTARKERWDHRNPKRSGKHESLDAGLKQTAAAIAERLRVDPSLASRAREYIDRTLPSVAGGEALELREWMDILDTMSVSRLRRFMIGDDARATRLRQSMPFLMVLSRDEHQAILKATGRES